MIIAADKVLEAIKKLNVGEGFEAGDLFSRLPSEEKVYWQLIEVKGKVNARVYRFKLYYREVFLRAETLYEKSGEISTHA